MDEPIHPSDVVFYEMAMAAPRAAAEWHHLLLMLDSQIERGKFNRDRCVQMIGMLIDRAAMRTIGNSVPLRIAMPIDMRDQFARAEAERFFTARNDIQSQRTTRTGLIALVLGK